MAKLLTLLFEVTAIFEMRTRPELLLLQKTMVVVEGVARTLDPKLDMWTTAEPVVSEWMLRNLGPAGRIEDAAGGVVEIGRFLGRVSDPAAPRRPPHGSARSRDPRRHRARAGDGRGDRPRRGAPQDRGPRRSLWVIAALVAMVALVIWVVEMAISIA